MDHIVDDFDLSASDLPPVENLTDGDVKLPDSWEAFQNFPRENGWAINEETLSPTLLKGSHGKTMEPLKFVQSWLFFGLIMTVVQRDGRPILGYRELVESDDDAGAGSAQRATTKHLPKALEEWRDWECRCENISDVRLRMVRAESVLDAARRIVRANYSHRLDDVTKQGSPDDIITLSLMILGETLSMVKARIMKQTQSRLKGWHSEDGNGWGPPSYVFHKMVREGWCKRTMHLWWSQLRGSATLTLASYFAYRSLDRFKGIQHRGCTEQKCLVTPEDNEGNYEPAHANGCTSCGPMQGPDMAVIKQYLEEDRIPLLEFKYSPTDGDSHQRLGLRVLEKPPSDSDPIDYVTISHVWSDGFGNESANVLHCCQLQYVRSILDKLDLPKRWKTPFWMDTLIIPVGQEDDKKTLRRQAIKQIFQVFKESKYTIVLDAGLSQMTPGRQAKPAVAAMRILGSSWMRRLWTLQEAFLSHQIYFAFANTHSNDHLREFNDLCRRLGSDPSVNVTTSLLNLVNDHLQHLVMSHEYKTRDKYLFKGASGSTNKKMPHERAAFLVASSWKAARWRTTSNEYHETLALATLLDLDLDYGQTSIVDAGLQQPNLTKESKEKMDSKKDKLVKEFWTQFNTSWPNSIPPGIIFLPGERVRLPGFGWAPRTWMTAQAVDHPDPLTFMTSTAELDTRVATGLNGLKVRYPGFLLDPQDRRYILSTDKSKSRFWFPTGPTFLDWYAVEFTPDEVTKKFLPSVVESQNQLGIIISRTSPGDSPAEIGLLVQIREPKVVKKEPLRSSGDGFEEQDPPSRSSLSSNCDQAGIYGKPLYCAVLGRVKVSRETRAEFRTRNRARFWMKNDDAGNMSQRQGALSDDASCQEQHELAIPQVMTGSIEKERICLAEELGSDQVWFVDGYFPAKHIEETQSEVSNKPRTFRSVRSLLSAIPRFRKPRPISRSNDSAGPPVLQPRSATVMIPPQQPGNGWRASLRRATFGRA